MNEVKMRKIWCLTQLFRDAYASGSVANADGSGIYYPTAQERAEQLASIVGQECWCRGQVKTPIEAVKLMAAAFAEAFGPLYVTHYPDGGPFCGLAFLSYISADPVVDCTSQDMALAMGVSLEEAKFKFLNDEEAPECKPLDISPFGEDVAWWLENSPDNDVEEVVSILYERWSMGA